MMEYTIKNELEEVHHDRKLKIRPGSPYPLGPTWDGKGVNFALFSENATSVELCLYDEQDSSQAATTIRVEEVTHHIWHVYVEGIGPGQQYGFRVDGPYEPEKGLRFNSHKLLVDPYAKALSGDVKWDPALFAYETTSEDQDLSYNSADSAPFIPKSVVVDPGFDWENDRAPKIAYCDTIIYEAHVKGLTKLHPDIPEQIRGTYAGLAHPVMVKYLTDLGITAVELMPVHHFVADGHLLDKGLTNYWGYNTLSFFAPDVKYSSSGAQGGQVTEFKNMVKTLHNAGIEVILDVVYNHTAEGNHLGPTLSFKGIDNISYYRLNNDDPRYYHDYTGTGNTLNARLPYVLGLIMDSLRYWVTEMHVDGFRFDLASSLARTLHETDTLSSFFNIIHQDPVISQVKLIAEPWDINEDGYMVGKFPPGWAEWNDMFRDCVRDYWKGAESKLAEFAERFAGSPDLYRGGYRSPTASINLITAHDGFTLHDLVSYNEKHNEANCEDNQDGGNDNRSCNCGIEGPSDDEQINALRSRYKRSLLASLFLSQGVPMLLAGDELGRTQQGNNNAYCQDNEISWIDWQNTDHELLDFTRDLIWFCKRHPSFRRRRWFQGLPVRGSKVEDIRWFSSDGSLMSDENWQHDLAKSFAVYLNGRGIRCVNANGDKITDDSFYIIFNAHHESMEFTLPAENLGKSWQLVIDTGKGFVGEESSQHQPGSVLTVQDRSVLVLKCSLDQC